MSHRISQDDPHPKSQKGQDSKLDDASDMNTQEVMDLAMFIDETVRESER